MYVLASPVKTWIFNKGFNLSFQLLAAVSFDVFALLPSVVFSYLFHHFSVAQIPSGCVWMHLAVGREGKEESHFSPPQATALIFQSCWEAVPVCLQKGQWPVSCLFRQHSSAEWISGLMRGRMSLCSVAFLSEWNVQLWSKGEAELQAGNISLLCFQPAQQLA